MQVSDNLILGNAQVLLPPDSNDPSPQTLGVGPMGRVYLWDTVPLASSATMLATAQAATGGITALTAGASVTTRVDGNGVTRYVLDVPRNVSVTAVGANTATAVVVGYDQYGQRMTESFAAPTTSTVTGNKAFKEIISVTWSATPGTNVSVGTGNKLGLPFAVRDVCYVCAVKWATTLAQDAGTFVAAVTTSPATATTGDVRGTYTPSSAPDGARRLVALLGLPGAASGPNATRLGAVGVDQA